MPLHGLRCAYCHASLFVGRACPRCQTRLHEDCWGLAGACPTLGCADARRTRHSTLGPPELYRRPSCLMWTLGCAAALACVIIVLALLGKGAGGAGGPLTRGLEEVLVIEGHAGHGRRVAFTPDGARLVAVFDAGAGVYSVADGRQLAFSTDLAREDEPFAVSPRGDLAAVGRAVVRLSDLGQVGRLPDLRRGGGVTFSRDGGLVACASHDREVASVGSGQPCGATLALIEPLGGREVRSVRLPPAFIEWSPPRCLPAFSPDGAVIAVSRTERVDLVLESRILPLPLPCQGAIEALAWDRHGLRAATRFRVVRWAAPLSGAPPEVVSIATTPSSGGFDRNFLWSVGLAPDGRRAAVGWHHPGVALVGDGPVLWGDHEGVYDAAFSPDGALLATAGYDNHLRVWHVPALAENGAIAPVTTAD